MKKGDTGTITWGDKSQSKVVVQQVITYPATGMPSDVMFKYQEDEKHRPLAHKDFGEEFPLPEGLVDLVFFKD